MRDPYSTVFRGRIEKTDGGSVIKGFFTKTVFDYIFTLAVVAIAFVMRFQAEARGADLYVSNVILIICIFGGLLLLYSFRPTKRRYIEFMCRITGVETDICKSRREQKEIIANASKEELDEARQKSERRR